MKKIIVVAGAFLIAVVGQITSPAMGIFFLGSWPAFIFVFLVSFFIKGVFPLAVAFLTGALIDLISGIHFGVFALTLFSIALIVRVAEERLKFSNPFAAGAVFILCALCFFGISHLLTYIF